MDMAIGLKPVDSTTPQSEEPRSKDWQPIPEPRRSTNYMNTLECLMMLAKYTATVGGSLSDEEVMTHKLRDWRKG